MNRCGRVSRSGRAIAVAALAAIMLSAAFSAEALARRHSAAGAAVTARMTLATSRLRAGGSTRGEIVFINRSSTPKVLLRTCRLDGYFGIGIRASDGYVTAPAFSLVGCGGEMVARPGRTVFRFTLRAQYLACVGAAKDGPPKGSPDWLPVCARGSNGRRDTPPPLPAGRYTALFVPDGHWMGPRVPGAHFAVTAG